MILIVLISETVHDITVKMTRPRTHVKLKPTMPVMPAMKANTPPSARVHCVPMLVAAQANPMNSDPIAAN